MRNLKRVLSLALSLVMVLGLLVITSSAASTTTSFKDADEITNVEAVEVLSALKVLEGDDNNNFNPTQILTRETAAKIICYMLIGPDNADRLGGSAAFTDVAADRWSAGYIAYCANLGIIAGTGDGSFNPEGQLTGVAFAKMLLVALGYDADIQGYVGENWAIAIATDAVAAGIDAKLNLSAPLAREDAAQMAFQTLTANTVSYASKGTNITTTDGTSVVVGASPAANVYSDTDYRVGNTTTVQQFCEKYFPNLKSNTAAADDFGRGAQTWTVKGVAVGTYTYDADATFTAAVSGSTTAAKLTAMGIKGFSLNGGSVTPKVNGKDGTAITNIADIPGLTGNGVLVELYFNDTTATQIDKIVVINTELAQVSAKSSSRVTLTSKTAAVTGTLTVGSTEDAFTDASAFDVGDYVLVIPVWDPTASAYVVDSIVAADSVTGSITTATGAADSRTALTVDGTSYSAAKNATNGVKGAVANANTQATLYLDAYGYAIDVQTVATAHMDYVYVLDTYSSLNGSKIVNMATVVKTNGETVDIAYTGSVDPLGLYSVVNSGNGTYALTAATAAISSSSGAKTVLATDGSQSDITGTLISTGGRYRGYVALTKNKGIAATDKALNKDVAGDGTAYIDNYYSSNVVFVYVDKTAKTALVKQGVQKVTTDSSANSYAVLEENSATDDTLVVTMVILENATAVTASASDLVFFPTNTVANNSTLTNTSTGKGESYNAYTGYQNGESKQFYLTDAPGANKFYSLNESATVPGLYVATEYTTDTGASAVAANKAASAPFDNRLITVADVTSPVSIGSAQIVDVRANAAKAAKPITTTAAGLCEAINTYKTVNVSVIYNANTNDAAIVYITGAGDGWTLTKSGDDNYVTYYSDAEHQTSIEKAVAGTTVYFMASGTTTTAGFTAGITYADIRDVTAGTGVTDGAAFDTGHVYSFTMPSADVTENMAS
jgi:hypothetical protein